MDQISQIPALYLLEKKKFKLCIYFFFPVAAFTEMKGVLLHHIRYDKRGTENRLTYTLWDYSAARKPEEKSQSFIIVWCISQSSRALRGNSLSSTL